MLPKAERIQIFNRYGTEFQTPEEILKITCGKKFKYMTLSPKELRDDVLKLKKRVTERKRSSK